MGIGTFVDRTLDPSTATHVRGQRAGGDLILIAAVIALVIFGLLMLYSASTDFSLTGLWFLDVHVRQAAGVAGHRRRWWPSASPASIITSGGALPCC